MAIIPLTRGKIPKIIHQTWKDENIPDMWKLSPVEWRRHHPDWTYILWTDAAIRSHIARYHPEFLELHDSYEYNIQRADMIRYFVLYDIGGVYSDLDLYPTESIESHLGDAGDCFIYASGPYKAFTNCLMASQKHSPIWLEAFEALRDPIPWWAFGKHLKVMTSTGPLFLDRVLSETAHPFTILPRKKFLPYTTKDDQSVDKPGTIIKPLQGSSWHEADSKVYSFVFKYYQEIVGALVVLLFVYYFVL
jgi:inositol phosphorylceramide mannosyltransferase catalytic subunit